jgi:hypothetical protein
VGQQKRAILDRKRDSESPFEVGQVVVRKWGTGFANLDHHGTFLLAS